MRLPARFLSLLILAAVASSRPALAACPAATGVTSTLVLNSTGRAVDCVYPDHDYTLGVSGPVDNHYYCTTPMAPYSWTPEVGYTLAPGMARCLDATQGKLSYPRGFAVRSDSALPAEGISGAVLPGACMNTAAPAPVDEVPFEFSVCPVRACTPPPNDLTAWFPLDESTGPVKDTSGSLLGTVTGATTVVGRVNMALSFDGIDDNVSVPSNNALNIGSNVDYPNFTLDAWIKTTDPSGAPIGLVSKRYFDTANGIWRGYLFYLFDGRPALQLGVYPSGHFNYQLSAGPKVNNGAWHLIAVTVDFSSTTGGRFYVDGNLANTFDPTNRRGNLATAAPFALGFSQGDSTMPHFKGALDEVELFRRALSEPEIKALYNAGGNGKCKQASSCGNGICLAGVENCYTCPQDCGACSPAPPKPTTSVSFSPASIGDYCRASVDPHSYVGFYGPTGITCYTVANGGILVMLGSGDPMAACGLLASPATVISANRGPSDSLICEVVQ